MLLLASLMIDYTDIYIVDSMMKEVYKSLSRKIYNNRD
jgi:hypothetical protein